jgi:hypothetical protein
MNANLTYHTCPGYDCSSNHMELINGLRVGDGAETW